MSSFSSTDGQSKSNYAGMSERRSIDYIPKANGMDTLLASSPFGLAAICKLRRLSLAL